MISYNGIDEVNPVSILNRIAAIRNELPSLQAEAQEMEVTQKQLIASLDRLAQTNAIAINELQSIPQQPHSSPSHLCVS
jgi:hypothetical protein